MRALLPIFPLIEMIITHTESRFHIYLSTCRLFCWWMKKKAFGVRYTLQVESCVCFCALRFGWNTHLMHICSVFCVNCLNNEKKMDSPIKWNKCIGIDVNATMPLMLLLLLLLLFFTEWHAVNEWMLCLIVEFHSKIKLIPVTIEMHEIRRRSSRLQFCMYVFSFVRLIPISNDSSRQKN